jgi:citrate lyase subunit beta / citryl-CoA lyase
MRRTSRPRRSILYVPGSNERALEKAKTVAADGLIFDLEDAVAPAAKEGARRNALKAVEAGEYGARELIIRINALETPWGHDDLAAAAGSGADAVLIPKVESAETVLSARAVMKDAGAVSERAIWCMIETPRGVLRAEEIADADPHIAALVAGTADLAKGLRCAHTRDRSSLITSLEMCLLAGRAAEISVIDGIHMDLEDDEGFSFSCRQGAEMGFDGKTLVHPKQLEQANQAFSPSKDEIARSHKIITAYEEAEKNGQGVVIVDGKLVERLHIENAHRLIMLDEAIRKLENQR